MRRGQTRRRITTGLEISRRSCFPPAVMGRGWHRRVWPAGGEAAGFSLASIIIRPPTCEPPRHFEPRCHCACALLFTLGSPATREKCGRIAHALPSFLVETGTLTGCAPGDELPRLRAVVNLTIKRHRSQLLQSARDTSVYRSITSTR